MIVSKLLLRGPAVLLALLSLAPAHAGQLPAFDAIERSIGRGDDAEALRLSAALLERLPPADRDRAEALRLRAEVLGETGAWKRERDALRASIEGLPDPAQRGFLQLVFAAGDAAAGGDMATALANDRAALAKTAPGLPALALRSAMARALYRAGRVDDARAEAEQGVAAARELHGPGARRHEVSLVLLLAQVDFQHDRFDAVLARANAAEALARAAFGDDGLARLRAADARASAFEATDRFAEAREIREEILRLARAHFGDHDLRTALDEASLGAHLQRTGNYAPARDHYARAEEIVAGLPDVGVRDRIILANNHANLLQEMGDEAGALAHYRVALELARDDRTRAIILTNVGNTEFRLGRYEDAIADFERALPLREAADGKDAAGLSFALEGLGSSALALGRFGAAETWFARAVALRSKGSAPNNSQLNVLNFGVALARWGLGEDAAAFALAVQTAERQQALLAALAADFSEQQSIAFDHLLVPATALAVTIAAESGDAARIATAWRLVMLERGLIARSEARRLAAARASADPALSGLYRDWRAANAALGAGWAANGTSSARMAGLQAAAEAAERALWVRLGHVPDDYASAARPVADLAAALPSRGILVAFTDGVGANPARVVNAGAAQSAEDLYAFVLRPRSAPRLLRVGRIDAIEAEARAWYALVRDPHSDTAQLQLRGADLRRDVLDAAAPAPEGTLFVVPFGELFRVSFAALPAAHGDGYWIESGLRVHTLAHESELTLPAPQTGPGERRVLLAGAPRFDAESGTASARQLCASVAERGFAAIPGAQRELGDLDQLLRGALGAEARIDLIDGAGATKQRVMSALAGAGIVHLATHGFSLDATCGGAGGARGMSVEATAVPGQSPAQPLSGLAFAGAAVASGRAPVGVLSAGELSAADLSRADWVVLSACDSGLGPIGRSEGVFGMRRALRLAGARTVVMSLWEADDPATADLMQALYRERFVAHRNVPDAMAHAMRSELAARRAAGRPTHPYYWAAFVAEGGWR